MNLYNTILLLCFFALQSFFASCRNSINREDFVKKQDTIFDKKSKTGEELDSLLNVIQQMTPCFLVDGCDLNNVEISGGKNVLFHIRIPQMKNSDYKELKKMNNSDLIELFKIFFRAYVMTKKGTITKEDGNDIFLPWGALILRMASCSYGAVVEIGEKRTETFYLKPDDVEDVVVNWMDAEKPHVKLEMALSEYKLDESSAKKVMDYIDFVKSGENYTDTPQALIKRAIEIESGNHSKKESVINIITDKITEYMYTLCEEEGLIEVVIAPEEE